MTSSQPKPRQLTAYDSDSVVSSCRNVWMIYGDVKALPNETPTKEELRRTGCIAAVEDVSLDVLRGETLVVMGLSGSGKSTLLRCLSLLIRPSFGAVHFERTDLLKLSHAELQKVRRHRMGMVFQNFALLPHRTVIDNVAFPLEVQGVAWSERSRRAKEMIDLVGLTGKESRYPAELSGGQQQRVGIARSLTVGPDLWFLDEPFSALDPIIRRGMQDEFLRLQTVLHKTIIFVTHDFDEAVRLGDRIAIMNEGRLIQVGTPEEILTGPADDYVKEFTRGVSRERVLTARQVLTQVDPAQEPERFVHDTDTLDLVARLSLESPRALGIKERSSGQLLGLVDRRALAEVLYG